MASFKMCGMDDIQNNIKDINSTITLIENKKEFIDKYIRKEM